MKKIWEVWYEKNENFGRVVRSLIAFIGFVFIWITNMYILYIILCTTIKL